MEYYELLRKYRVLSNLTQREVADKLGMTHSAYSKYERGERKITIDLLKKLSSIIHLPDRDFKFDSLSFDRKDMLDFDTDYMVIAKQVQFRKNEMTEDEIENARELFVQKYNDIESRKREIMALLKPEKLEDVIQNYGISFLFIEKK